MQSNEISTTTVQNTTSFESAADMSDAELLEVAGFAANAPPPTDDELRNVVAEKSWVTSLGSARVVIVETGESQDEALARTGLSPIQDGVVFGEPLDALL
jgi:hypothetical protein